MASVCGRSILGGECVCVCVDVVHKLDKLYQCRQAKVSVYGEVVGLTHNL